jgi:RNA polymerase sigma-70 factor, ECF subfamily
MEMLMDRSDFSSIYSEHREMVWKLVSKYVFQQSDKEDLFQEVFLNVYRSLNGFREDSAVGTWIFRIAVNTSINYVKNQQRRRKLQEVFQGFRHLWSYEPAVVTGGDPMFEPLKKLNPRQRMILLLAEVEERKLEDIAKAMNISVGTVKSNLYRAKETIKKEVKRNGI